MKSIARNLLLVAVLSIGIISLTACSPSKKTTDDCCLSSAKVISIVVLNI